MSDHKMQPENQPTTKMCIPCEVYSRIVGYLRPIRNWNEGKRQEFEDRQTFRVPEEATPTR